MITKTVKSSEMLSILALTVAKDMHPEPYSRQSNLQLIISFTEFVKLCSNIRQYGDSVLSTPSGTLEKLARNYVHSDEDKRELQKIYMQEVSYAILKEISYQQRFGKGLTKIGHFLHDKVQLSYEVFKQEFSESQLVLGMLVRRITALGYPVNVEALSEEAYYAIHHSLALYKYAGTDMSYK